MGHEIVVNGFLGCFEIATNPGWGDVAIGVFRFRARQSCPTQE
jgi:hypothetical protein